MSDKNQYEVTAAETKSIGFDYQYYYFLLLLLRLRAGQKIGLEVKDDVHIEFEDGKLILLQLKHTTQTASSGSLINLTERDSDLWKTINNWISIVQDEAEGRKAERSQLAFLANTSFVLVSNKSNNTRNKFFTKVNDLNLGAITVEDFKKYLNELLTNTEDTEANTDLRNRITKLHDLKDKTLLAFVKKIEFQLGEDDLISKIKKEIEGFMIQPEKVDDVYANLNSALRDNNYITVKSKAKIEINHSEFLNKYRNCFGRMRALPIRKIDPILPDDYNAQMFVKQLIDIGDVDTSEKDQIIGYTKLRLLMYNNMAQWIHNGELTGPQKQDFERICVTHWNNTFRASHQKNRSAINQGSSMGSLEDDIVDAANKCLFELRKIILKIEDEELDLEVSNGQFYQLADELKIGWHLDWENKYKRI
jgi:hypothetical protein